MKKILLSFIVFSLFSCGEFLYASTNLDPIVSHSVNIEIMSSEEGGNNSWFLTGYAIDGNYEQTINLDLLSFTMDIDGKNKFNEIKPGKSKKLAIVIYGDAQSVGSLDVVLFFNKINTVTNNVLIKDAKVEISIFPVTRETWEKYSSNSYCNGYEILTASGNAIDTTRTPHYNSLAKRVVIPFNYDGDEMCETLNMQINLNYDSTSCLANQKWLNQIKSNSTTDPTAFNDKNQYVDPLLTIAKDEIY